MGLIVMTKIRPVVHTSRHGLHYYLRRIIYIVFVVCIIYYPISTIIIIIINIVIIIIIISFFIITVNTVWFSRQNVCVRVTSELSIYVASIKR